MTVATKKKQNALKGKGGLVMLAVLAVLSVWLVVEMRKPVREEGAEPLVSEYVGLTSGDVRRVEVKRPDGGFVLVRQGDGWQFESPSKFRANPETVKTWLEGFLEKANVTHAIETKPATSQMAQFGLDEPAVEVVLNGNRTLQVGKEYPVSSASSAGYYAREAKDGRLFMLASTQVNDLKTKKAADLRDKRLTQLGDAKQVQKVVLQRQNGAVELQRRAEDKWEMVQPFRAPADRSTVEETLLWEIKNGEAESFVPGEPADLAKYGLDQPQLTVQVTDGKGTHSVKFGKVVGNDKVYAQRDGEADVALVPKAVYDNIDKKLGDLRGKELISMQNDKVTYVEVVNPHGTVKLQKHGSDNWQFADAADPKQKRAKADRVDQIVRNVTGSAYKYVEEAPADLKKYGLDPAPIAVTVNQGAGNSQVFLLGKKGPDGYYAKGPGTAVFQVQQYVYDDLNVKRDDLVDTEAKK